MKLNQIDLLSILVLNNNSNRFLYFDRKEYIIVYKEEKMNYKKQLVKFDVKYMINLSLIMFIVPFVVSLIINIMVFDTSQTITGKIYFDLLILISSIIMLLIMHEGIHALGFIIFGKLNAKDIGFGIIPKQGMIYCTAKKPMKAKEYMVALILPIIFTGIIPLIVSTVWGNYIWIFVFSIMVSGGAGDIIMFNQVRKLDKNQMILDHPKAPAYYLIYEEGNEPEDFLEVTEEMEKEIEEELKKNPFEGKENSKKNLALKLIKIIFFLFILFIILFIIGSLLIL